ncbi:MAG: NrfD/PsrC family molybdoenzyme membrane anchor subunit [Chloroflexia bacterium]
MKDWLRGHPYFLPWTALLLLLLAVGGVGAWHVYTRGLVVTGMHDLAPWGLWITVDLSAIGLGAGAFLLSAAIYLLHLREFRPLARVAVVVGLLGYTSAALALFLDLGRPDRFWHPLVFWNPHSVLWEITMCVVLYTGVLVMEAAPIVGYARWFESRAPRLARLLQKAHDLAPVLAVLGLFLSLLHQSSLGATYAVLTARPLWGKPGTAVMFLANAVAAGPALTIVATLVAGRVLRRAVVPRETLERLGRFVGAALAVYLYIRLWDLLAMAYTHLPGRVEGLELLTRGPLSPTFWLGEMLLGGLVPVLLLLVPRLREQPWALGVGCGLAAIGLVCARWDVNLSALLVHVGYVPGELVGALTTYRPTWVEWVTTLAILAHALLGFTLAVQFLPLFGAEPVRATAALREQAATVPPGSRPGRKRQAEDGGASRRKGGDRTRNLWPGGNRGRALRNPP